MIYQVEEIQRKVLNKNVINNLFIEEHYRLYSITLGTQRSRAVTINDIQSTGKDGGES